MRYFPEASIDEFFSDFSHPITSSDSFRQGMRRLTSGVTVVTSRSEANEPLGMTATAVCSLSVSPPSLLVCAYSLGSLAMAIKRTSPLCVNLLTAGQEAIARTCSGAPGPQRFQSADWSMDEDGVPVLNTALARFHCRVTELIPVATHLLIVGQVAHVHLPEKSGAALAYHDGKFISVGCDQPSD
jgi:flavin reductase (DIM6/NTAB) family NADH-FMN oxidoreductase RutF